jgi:DtxR family transcriptional regulator, manganese transport regulator
VFQIQYNVLPSKQQRQFRMLLEWVTRALRRTATLGCPGAKAGRAQAKPAVTGITGHGGGFLLSIALVTAAMRKRRRASLSRSESTEDHLERIQELLDRKGYARVADTAASLGLSRSAVSNMVRRLARRGYVNYERYRGFTLTPAGRQVAQHIKARDRILTKMFEMLGLDPETVKKEVEDIEHHLRPQTLAVFSKLVSFWREHPQQLQAFLRYTKRK